MGQKVHPVGFRIGVNKTWSSKWYADKKDYSEVLAKDMKLRNFLSERLNDTSVGQINIERTPNRVELFIHTSKPGIIIGRGGEEMKKLIADIKKLGEDNVQVSIVDVKKPDIDATIVAKSIAKQIENRVSIRMAQRRAISNAMRNGAKGIKVMLAGRLNGVEMARTDWHSDGTVPLHTLRADIDYATAEAHTTFGKIGVKVWIYKGDILGSEMPLENKASREKNNNRNRNNNRNNNRNRNFNKEEVSKGGDDNANTIKN